ncbi:MAG: CheR family methyltransferase [Acidobacteriota bacterium]
MSQTVLEASLPSLGAAEFRLFRDLIHRHTGIWLREGKQVMLASRLSRRLRAHRLTSFTDYYQYLETHDNGGELGELINCVTTNKTAFFREPHHFRFLAETLVPEAMAHTRGAMGASDGRPALRLWSAACSTGEEPYSIAITLLESQSRLHWPASSSAMRVIASDIDTSVLETARRGIYAAEETEEIDPSTLKKYFLRGTDAMAGQVRVKKPVAALVEFERINLMDRTWAVTGPFDAIFFRNALIYFRQETQDLFLRRMIRLLRPGGYLILGHSEHIPWLHDVLEPLQQTTYRVRSGNR